MTMMVQGSEEIAEVALPVADLVAALRLPDGYETVPGQMARLQARLRAAVETVEARSGKILLARQVTLTGGATGSGREALPVAPIAEVVSATMRQGPDDVALPDARLEPQGHRPVLVLGRHVRAGTALKVTVEAGYSAWAQVPAPLREAVLTFARGLDGGEDVAGTVDALIAPYRLRRIGGAA